MADSWMSRLWAIVTRRKMALSLVRVKEPDLSVKSRALAKLWRSVFDEVNIRYPDPRVTIKTSFLPSSDGSLLIHVTMFNVVDSGNVKYDVSGPNGFLVDPRVDSWPGRSCARAWIAAFWSVMLMHEAQEMVTWKNASHEYVVPDMFGRVQTIRGGMPVVNPHLSSSANQRAFRSLRDIGATLDLVMGPGEGANAVYLESERAARELADAVAFVREHSATVSLG